ncbi:MAG TPA: hypothetical protein VHG51_10050 [Longimicrobiaceae bacterium]|nr:hypothetical protein [Longimicrobiaceae bacterium]
MSCTPLTPPDPNRRDTARSKRIQAADIAYNRPHPAQLNNCEERDYPYVANYSKGLQHDANGDVIPASYQSLLTALQNRTHSSFEAVQLGTPSGGLRLTNPQAGLAFTLEGPDPQALTQPPAPRIDSAQNSSEMAELYWMALARDVHFSNYGTDATIQQAIQSLNTEFTDFRGPKVNGQVTAQTVFRGIFPGETTGPYLSQFLWKGNSDPRAPDWQGRSAQDGFITYGVLKIDQRRWTVLPGTQSDFLTEYSWWLEAQNGVDKRGMDRFDMTQRRFIRNLRDLANFVHFDQVLDAFYNAALILISEPRGNQLLSSLRPLADIEFRNDVGNPYDPAPPRTPSRTQVGFATFGTTHVLTLLSEALIRALRAVWYQKWFVHRRLRPEEFGGRIHNHLTGRRLYPQINAQILNSLKTGKLAPYFGQAGERFPTYLLPQAYPEGAPTHPAYGAGHATGAGACATILKAFFHESQAIENPQVPTADGTKLMAYTGPGYNQMTVGGELNKLAGNIALGRNGAGVHWRTDYDQSLLLGETIAIQLLQEQSILFNEPDFFELRRFDGTCVRIQNGTVTACPVVYGTYPSAVGGVGGEIL